MDLSFYRDDQAESSQNKNEKTLEPNEAERHRTDQMVRHDMSCFCPSAVLLSFFFVWQCLGRGRRMETRELPLWH